MTKWEARLWVLILGLFAFAFITVGVAVLVKLIMNGVFYG